MRIYHVYFFLILCFSPAANSGDAVSEEFIEELESHFFSKENLDPAGKISRDLLLSPGFQKETLSLLSQLKTALNEGKDLTPLQRYGVIVRDDESVSIDLVEHPGWATAYQLLSLALPEHDQQLMHEFKTRGASLELLELSQDIEPVAEARARGSRRASAELMAIVPLAQKNKAVGRSNHQLYLAAQKKMDKVKNEEKTRWADRVLRSINKQDQRILVAVALEKASVLFIYPDLPVTEAQSEKNVDMIIRRTEDVRNND